MMLRHRNERIAETQDITAALPVAALAEASAVLNESIDAVAVTAGQVSAEGLFEVARLHMFREIVLASCPEQERETAV